MSNILEQMQKDLYDGNVDEVRAATEKALAKGLPAQEILSDGLIAGMDQVGHVGGAPVTAGFTGEIGADAYAADAATAVDTARSLIA